MVIGVVGSDSCCCGCTDRIAMVLVVLVVVGVVLAPCLCLGQVKMFIFFINILTRHHGVGGSQSKRETLACQKEIDEIDQVV